MKNLRTIVYKTLVDDFGVSPSLLSRIDGNEPVTIELNGGEEISICLNDGVLQAFIEIPIRDQRVLRSKAGEIIEILTSDDEMFFNIKKDKIIVATEFSTEIVNAERILAYKLKLFNNMVDYIVK